MSSRFRLHGAVWAVGSVSGEALGGPHGGSREERRMFDER